MIVDFYLSAMVHVRNEAPYLDEWISFHRALGVQHFWIYDNNSTDRLDQAIAPHADIVELVRWPQSPAVPASIQDCLDRAKPRTRWLALIDADEYLVPDSGEPAELMWLLQQAEPWAGHVLGHWRMFGSGSHVVIPEGRVTDNYLFRDERWYQEFKSIVQPLKVGSPLSTHAFDECEGWPRWDSGRLHIFHYRNKSKEDYLLRNDRQQVDSWPEHDRLALWQSIDRSANSVYDGQAARLARKFNTPGTRRHLGNEPVKVMIYNHNQPRACVLKEQLSECFDVSVLDSGSCQVPPCTDHAEANLYWTGCMNRIWELYSDRPIIWAIPGDVTLLDRARLYKQAILSSFPFGMWSPRLIGKSLPSMTCDRADGVYSVRFIEGICFAFSRALSLNVMPLSERSTLGWGQDVLMSGRAIELGMRNILDARVTALHSHEQNYQTYDPVKAQEQMYSLGPEGTKAFCYSQNENRLEGPFPP